MKILEVPILNDDGSLNCTASFTAEEVQTLIQFAVNMSASVGLGVDAKARERRAQQAEGDEEEHTVQ